ncbi:hypothetical protein M406DRAFT_259537 [Cryphonectria parasitica EP155]|uniref:Rho1 guanine nucleotide exchange factor 3 n=1 Tax=Cryphonectria parasitica (strain ATCC 38755 / EP155) TaxID=660469 RepID=A0A9P4Y1Y7_CRYP1|nr:uncharacterized protein M406DRAFT_259537 [Cryphonectria parasitica EP155]KAF3765136.1 hypothetical protein M406DRAFT_259537 [Cryphonectria parasitica EP155]
MSFRGNNPRYGHLPPVQYPVAGHGQNVYPPRRGSFNEGDDAAADPARHHSPSMGRQAEGYMTSPTASAAGYQQSYQNQAQQPPLSPTSYNPQDFARSSSTTLPYHPAARYASPPAHPTSYTPQPTTYNHATYDPSAYAGVSPTQQRYNQYGHVYSSSMASQQANASYSSQQENPPYSPTYNHHEVVSPQMHAAAAAGGGNSQYAPSLPSPQYSSHSTPSMTPTPFQAAWTGGLHQSNGTTSPQGPQYTAQAPYPGSFQMPVGPNYSAADPNAAFMTSRTRQASHTSPAPSPPVYDQPSSPGLARHPTNAPLPSRPTEMTPDERAGDPSLTYFSNEQVAQESLMEDIFNDLGGEGGHASRPAPINGNISDDDLDRLRTSFDSRASTMQGTISTGVGRYNSNASTLNSRSTPATFFEDDDSDGDGAAGLAMMQEDELTDRRFSGNTSYSLYPPNHPVATSSLPAPPEEQPSGSDSEYAGALDLAALSGGYTPNLNLSYDNNAASPPARSTSLQSRERPLPPPPTDQTLPYPDDDSDDGGYYGLAIDVDYGDTGGLQAPTAQRRSFDEGDDRASGSDSPVKEDLPDLFFHPGLSNRPLPALPGGSDTSPSLSVQSPSRGPSQHSYSLSSDSRVQRADGFDVGQQPLTHQQQVERSISLSSHTTTPAVQVPGRSRTDAAEERRKALRQQQHQHNGSQLGTPLEGYETGTPSPMAYDLITLPSGRKKKFIPEKLSTGDCKRCAEPWALSSIAAWLREMAEGEPDLKRKTVEDGLTKLFTTKVPTMNIADAETLGVIVADRLYEAGILLEDEEWVKFGQGTLSGVLWQLTGSGCYAPKVHETEVGGRCYSYHCTRTLKKANLDELLADESEHHADWATFYKLDKAGVEAKPKKETERQNILHEIVTGEEDYMAQLEVVRLLYRDQLKAWAPPIIPPAKINAFVDKVFGKVDAVHQVNKEYLLAQLKYRQNEQGPWITGFSDIFRDWIRKAEAPYLEFSAAFPHAQLAIRKEASRNVLFAQFLEHVQRHKRSNRLGWDTFLKAPITRLQRYSLLLDASLKKMVQDSEEKTNLLKALEEIRAVTHKCDEAVARSKSKVDLHMLQSALVLRPGFQSVLNLDHLGRQLIHQGDLTRMGSKGVRWVDTHALLFDHYFILAKEYPSKDGKDKKYDVSKEPIPMPLLFLESMRDEPVMKQGGLRAPLTRTAIANASGTQLNKVMSNGDRPVLSHSDTGSSMGSLNMNAVTRINTASSADSVLFPFRVKHLGHEVYTLYATSQQDRELWCSKIIEAKTQHARALHAQNAEPFRLRILADGAFAYDTVSAIGKTPGVPIKGTPLDRSIREIEKIYGSGRGPPAVCRAQVNCATAFTAFNKSLVAIGTDYGVYISEASNPRGWTRSVQLARVTQIAVLEEFSICLITADRSLIAYPLETIAPTSNFPAASHDSVRKAPQRLAKDVTFFATARMKERMLIFYKRKEGMHTTFKVLEPVFQRSSEKRPRIFGGRRGGNGLTESFRDFDEFYLPTECYSLNLFQTYIAVATAKGFEMLTLDKKQTMSVPSGLGQPTIANIANRIRDQRPLGMFKLNEQEFILAYEDCAVYVDKHGEVSRTLIMEYSGKQKKARGATMFGQYLVLFNEDYVEVRNAENGRLRQIVAGRDVRCLDYGVRGPTGAGGVGAGSIIAGEQDSKGTVKITMTHPEVPGMQIILELLLNDGHDKAG